MTDATWAACPRTTNACESQNKISHAKSSSTFAALQTLYRTDRRSAYYNAAAKRGITTGVSDRKRRITNQKKLRRINRPKLMTATMFRPLRHQQDWRKRLGIYKC
jgi:hypothetical protein